MSIYLERQPNQKEIQAGDLNSRPFFIGPESSHQLHQLSSEVYESSKDLRWIQGVTFAMEGNAQPDDLEIFKLTLTPHHVQSDAWNWQAIMRRHGERSIILDCTATEHTTEWQHIEVDDQGSLWRQAHLIDTGQALAEFIFLTVQRSGFRQDFERLRNARLQLAESLEAVKGAPRSPEFHKKYTEAKTCLQGIKLFSVGNRKTAFARSFKETYRRVEEMPPSILELLVSDNHKARVEYRPADLSKIPIITSTLRALADK